MLKRNWSQYNRQLVQRGSLHFLIDSKSLQSARVGRCRGKTGRPLEFSDQLILVLMMVKVHYRLAYRALEGFARSFHHFARTGVAIPTYSLICKRAAKLGQSLPKLSRRRPNYVILDASGLKVVGEGEWKVKVHGQERRRQWIKVHLGVDAQSQEIVAEMMTASEVCDGKMAGFLLNQVKGKVKGVLADGAYDERSARDQVKARGAKAHIPPPRNGRLRGDPDRDEALRIMHGLGNDRTARSIWGKLTGYSKRSLVETAFSRMKRVFGDRLFSKVFDKQRIEVTLRCILLNKMIRTTT
ncbi:MAG: IS5 family transposase [Candidatus Obscuribacterales bacterium]